MIDAQLLPEPADRGSPWPPAAQLTLFEMPSTRLASEMRAASASQRRSPGRRRVSSPPLCVPHVLLAATQPPPSLHRVCVVGSPMGHGCSVFTPLVLHAEAHRSTSAPRQFLARISFLLEASLFIKQGPYGFIGSSWWRQRKRSKGPGPGDW